MLGTGEAKVICHSSSPSNLVSPSWGCTPQQSPEGLVKVRWVRRTGSGGTAKRKLGNRTKARVQGSLVRKRIVEWSSPNGMRQITQRVAVCRLQ